MKKNIFVITVLAILIFSSFSAFSATVIKKEDAALFSKKSIYSDVGVQETGAVKDSADDTGTGFTVQNDDSLNKFAVTTATKSGNTYTNKWSGYTITIENDFSNASDDYDFFSDGVKFDFGIVFNDYSRLAVYYSRLSRDISIVCANFAPGSEIEDVEIAGQVYKHVSLDVKYPYGVEKYNYYLRSIDGKLMVIETYHEDGREISTEYIDQFEAIQ